MHGLEKRFVYILRSDADPARHYVGITSNLRDRLGWHNDGPSGHTLRHRPWSLVVSMEFSTETSWGDEEHEDDDCESHISEIKQRLDEISGGDILAWESDALPVEERKKFWRRVLAFESGPLAWQSTPLVG